VNLKGWTGVRATGGGESEKSLIANASAPVGSAEALLADEMLNLKETGKRSETTRQSISEAGGVNSSSDPGRGFNGNKPGICKESRTPRDEGVTESSPGIGKHFDSMGKGTKGTRNGRGPSRVPPIDSVKRDRVVPSSPPGPEGRVAPTQTVVERGPSESGPASSSVEEGTGVNTVDGPFVGQKPCRIQHGIAAGLSQRTWLEPGQDSLP